MITRRELLWNTGGGLGALALACLMSEDSALGVPHHAPKAKRIIQLFMSGAASQVDTFDYKPDLIKRNGEKFDPGGKVELFQSKPENNMKSPWAWRRYGSCGRWVSDLLPNLAGCVDDMAFIY